MIDYISGAAAVIQLRRRVKRPTNGSEERVTRGILRMIQTDVVEELIEFDIRRVDGADGANKGDHATGIVVTDVSTVEQFDGFAAEADEVHKADRFVEPALCHVAKHAVGDSEGR